MAGVGKLEDPSADGVVAESAIEIGFDAMRKSFPKYPVGTKVLKYFNGHGWFHGVISRQDQLRKAPSCLARVPWVPTYLIEYDDGDREWQTTAQSRCWWTMRHAWPKASATRLGLLGRPTPNHRGSSIMKRSNRWNVKGACSSIETMLLRRINTSMKHAPSTEYALCLAYLPCCRERNRHVSNLKRR